MNAVPRLWPGDTIAILGTGPSLTQADADYVRGRARVIAINTAMKLAEWADVWYSSDQGFWRRQGGHSFAGVKFGVMPTKGQTRRPPMVSDDIFFAGNTGPLGLETDPCGIRHGKNSGFAAINLAVHFGAARILLLGYNLGPVGSVAHFDSAPASGCSYDAFARAYTSMVGPLKQLGVEVINCTHPTRLTCFAQAPLRDVLDRQVAA